MVAGVCAVVMTHELQTSLAKAEGGEIDRQILVDIFTISAAKHILWQLVWEKKHILLQCSMLHESGYP